MPLQATSGAASYDAFGGGAAVVPNYIEDVFSCFVYAGSNSSQTITNGIDLSTNGGLVWTKARTTTYYHCLTDTIRGGNKQLFSNTTDASTTSSPAEITSFNTTGYTLAGGTVENVAGQNFVGWTFRKQPKFFDCGTFTAGESTNRRISHALGSAPAFIIIKNTSQVGAWYCYHRSLGRSSYLELQSANAQDTGISNVWGTSDPTSTDFGVKETAFFASGDTVVYYVFAHDAGGFGLTGTDNVISCGSFTSNGSGGISPVNLGFEPQWLLVKNTSSDGWRIQDVMRGWSQTQLQDLSPNNSDGERVLNNNPSYLSPTATGFSTPTPGIFTANNTFIYIAIRRGPMKVPTSGTSVFEPQLYTGTGTTLNVTGPTNAFQYDSLIQKGRSGDLSNYAGNGVWTSKLQKMSTSAGGESRFMGPAVTLAETAGGIETYTNVGFTISGGSLNIDGTPYVNYWLRRAPSFFDVVCYTGTGTTNRSITHNLASTPEFLIVKKRSSPQDWHVYHNGLSTPLNKIIVLNSSNTEIDVGSAFWGVSSTDFSLPASGGGGLNNNGDTYVAYLFATCAGVSKVGSYTGNGSNQTINCGFTGGARFVMVKATSTTGNWIVADSARGIVAGNDPALYLNSTAAEVTGLDWIDADNSGFVVNETATIAANTNGVSYIFLAIA